MSNRGFTLIELLIVVGILGTLATLFAANAQSSMQETRAVVCEQGRCLFEDMEQKFEHDKGRPSLSVQELVDAKYITRHPCPRHGVITWKIADDHKELVCSIHGEKQRIRKWIPPRETGPAFLLASGFGGPVADGWGESMGRYWQLVDGRYRAGTLSRKRPGQHRSFAGNEKWTDYDFLVTTNLLRGNGYALYFRTTGTRKVNGYALEFIPGGRGTVRIREVKNGRHGKTLAKTRMAKGYEWNTERRVAVKVRGSTFTAFVDGAKVLSAKSDKYKAGAVGLRSHNRAVVDFDDVKVEQK